jgi:hypothetical protein
MSLRHIGLLGLLLYSLLACAPQPTGQAPIQVGLVVQEGEGSVQTYCVTLDMRDPSGYDALMLAGPPVQALVSAQGVAVCQIGEVGCPTGDCFCRCQGSTCDYWAYSHLRNGHWQTAATGAGGRRLSHGDVEGWRWGGGSPPPVIDFEELCAPGGQAAGAQSERP